MDTSLTASGGPARFTVVRAVSDDWATIRAVRLAALADSPSAFGSTLSRELEFDEARWRRWAESSAVFIAVRDGGALGEGGVPCGMAGGVAADVPGERLLVAVWVEPGARGHGVSSLLLDGVERWALADGARCVRLWFTRGNDPARRLYARRGYVETGRSKALPSAPGLVEDEMMLILASSTVA